MATARERVHFDHHVLPVAKNSASLRLFSRFACQANPGLLLSGDPPRRSCFNA
jgi:hypothetical protein